MPNPTDYFDIESDLSSDARLVRDTTRSFVQKEFMPLVREHYRAGSFPLSLAPRLGELGMLGANLSGYGLPGLDAVSYGLLMQELERGDSGLRSFASVQGALVMFPIFAFGTEAQRSYWLPRLASGRTVGCFGLTEPDYGSDPSRMITRAVKDGNSYLLNGVKMWITNGTIADVAVVWAKVDDTVRAFLVTSDTPGFSSREVSGKLSLRASVTAELVLDDARIPEENLLPGAHGLRSALECLTQARYGIAWGALGAAMACFEEALSYSKERKVFGRPVASFQLTQAKLADMATGITHGQLLALQLGRLKDAGRLRPEQVSLAKRSNVRMALETARSARSILAANGIIDEYQCMRHMCNLETVETYEGTYEVHTLVVGRDLTGFDAFS
ncbi:acyl-CoA dehydrogenase family protein [Geomonas sp. RF6]|uniref:acyl-CoA dehydrogenase family protein n=1 Tax=Geomonas sp. RF6 TaxID=2897342 RepID=UPI001E3A9D35|nr:acyl-CoA dehydrogenase family protein [Geomonas sp. RF6]UFS69592.1 acyl-CoA dehydrogenase family protein [Geomonas sp. RF6]